VNSELFIVKQLLKYMPALLLGETRQATRCRDYICNRRELICDVIIIKGIKSWLAMIFGAIAERYMTVIWLIMLLALKNLEQSDA
jgi:hypothetical protein